ncbi:probable ubiquitin carboxyl-terminal hydrolase MINDY-4 isoform X2 [Nilaparvata lugens]|uniref:probable ubiquitin carboxyl-terminal hydrolase MINDY-4 isoform X2 n=1 Tax=Nilaparvata lugens TaxID=108931 RepID=UPI00193D2B32|nr:probable ubiquitin carboxyl-terminal hydrolase MINDY-4 isoform X2 [Nilaparvata lugens]
MHPFHRKHAGSISTARGVSPTQCKSKYMSRDEDCLTSDESPLQGYGADQPRDYPKHHSQSCLRDREEILMSSLRRPPDYLKNDNSIRLGPNKVNTFQCLKTNFDIGSSNDETAKKYERFARIVPKISKRLSDSSLAIEKSLHDNDEEKEVPCESTKHFLSPTEYNRSTSPYPEEGFTTCNSSSEKQESSEEINNSENKCAPDSNECTNKEDLSTYNDEVNMNLDSSGSEQSKSSEITDINRNSSDESNSIKIPIDTNLKKMKNGYPRKDTSENKEELIENSINSLEIEDEDDTDEVDCESSNSLKGEKVENFCISDYEDLVYEQVGLLTFEPISTKLSKRLTKLFLGNESSLDVPSRWKGQSFVFNDSTKLKYGLMQSQGGPCGVIAVVQAFLLKALLFDDKTQAVCQDPFRPTQVELRTGLVQAISEILWQAGKGESAVLALYKTAGDEVDNDDDVKEEEGKNEDKKKENIICRKFFKLQELQSAVRKELNQFLSTDGNGCYLVAISAILSSGIQSVLSDMDEASSSLIVNGGSCSLELVNLLLTGNAVSNVFDNNMHIGPCLLKGISKRSNIGFLSIYEHTNTCQVGSNLKTPRYPIWVVNCQNHFTVIYSENKKLISDWRAERQFNIYLYDSMSNQKDEVKLTIDTTGLYLKPRSDGEYVPPIELCLLTKWKGAAISWNGNKYM